MVGGYMTFQGIDAKARYHGTPVEDVLPVTISPHDDRVEAPQGAGPKVAMKNHAIVAGIGGRWPALLGYNRLTAKPGADVVATVKFFTFGG